MIKLSSEKQKKKHYIIKVSGGVDLLTVNKKEAIKQVENAIEGLEWNTGLEFSLDINEEVDKITLQLDQDKKVEIYIISKAFSISPGEFIKLALKNELHYIKGVLEAPYPKENLEDYYKFEININSLRKLILVEEVL